MKRIVKEPLLHFLLLGAGLFVLYATTQESGKGGDPQNIVVTRGLIEHLAAGFARTWQRPPTPEELTGLVRDRIREEVYCREAMALGLDRDDTIIRRRLRQKMEFISDDIAAQAEPTDAELTAYLRSHPDAFRLEPRFTFRQVYLNPQKRAGHLAQDAATLLTELDQARDPAAAAERGDPLMLEPRFEALPASQVARQFGEEFAAKLPVVPARRWQGPIESGYGVHLVFVEERTDGRLPDVAEVRDAVRREWQNARRLESNERFYQELLRRYTVTIEGAEPAEPVTKIAATQAR